MIVKVFDEFDCLCPPATAKSVGWDIKLPTPLKLKKGRIVMVDTGIRVKPPAGVFTIVAVRSSTPLRWGLTLANNIGIIDPDYCGWEDSIKLLFYALRDTEVPAGTRVAQLVFLPVMNIEVKKVSADEFKKEANRGGIGNTGR